MSKPIAPLPPGSRKSQDLGGYAEMSLDELDRIMQTDDDPVAKAKAEEEEKAKAEEDDDGIDPADEEEEQDEPDKSDKPDEDEPDEDEPEPDDEKEEKADEADKDSEEKVEEEPPLEKRIRLLERRLELESLERMKESEARKRAELLASKQAGRAGYLQQQLKKSPAKAQPKKAEDDADEDPWGGEADPQDNRQEQNQPSQETEAWAEDRAELVKMAINDEGNEFAKRHAHELEEMPEDFIGRLQELMKEEAAPYADEFRTGSMRTVRKLARSLMNSAYATARIEFADKVAENAKATASKRKAESVEKSKRRKAKAAISKGGAKATKKAPRQKSYEDMSLEELEAEMKKEFGENYRYGSDVSRHGGL